MTILTVDHVTTYSYSRPVRLGDHRLLLRPRDSHDQRLLASTLTITPTPARLRWILDVFGNCVALVSFGAETTMGLTVRNTITLDHSPEEGPNFELSQDAQLHPFAYADDEKPDLAAAMARGFYDPDDAVEAWARRFIKPGGVTRTAELLMTMTYAIKESFYYERREEPGVQSPLHTLIRRRGSCRDFAVLMMEAARTLGFAARFVSGYLYSPEEDGGVANVGGGSTHAWCQVYLPGAGWVEFDPTNGIVGSRDLIRVAVTRDPRQATPLSGSFFGSREDEAGMNVTVDVRRSN